MSRLRSSEWLVIAYFTYVAIAARFFHLSWMPGGLAVVIFALVWTVSRTESLARDLLPVFYTLVAYREMNWFTPTVHEHRLERMFIAWDRWMLNDFHLRAAIESMGSLFPGYFEFCYLIVYAIAPASVALLFLNGRRGEINRFWIAYLAGTLGAYALFPYFPSEPPRTAFAGSDLPHVETVVRHINLWIVGGYGIHSSVFPSAHVSSALSAAWGLLAAIPARKWIGGLMAVYGISVAIATIYGRYHYAADAVAGIAVSLAALAVVQMDRFIASKYS